MDQELKNLYIPYFNDSGLAFLNSTLAYCEKHIKVRSKEILKEKFQQNNDSSSKKRSYLKLTIQLTSEQMKQIVNCQTKLFRDFFTQFIKKYCQQLKNFLEDAYGNQNLKNWRKFIIQNPINLLGMIIEPYLKSGKINIEDQKQTQKKHFIDVQKNKMLIERSILRQCEDQIIINQKMDLEQMETEYKSFLQEKFNLEIQGSIEKQEQQKQQLQQQSQQQQSKFGNEQNNGETQTQSIEDKNDNGNFLNIEKIKNASSILLNKINTVYFDLYKYQLKKEQVFPCIENIIYEWVNDHIVNQKTQLNQIQDIKQQKFQLQLQQQQGKLQQFQQQQQQYPIQKIQPFISESSQKKNSPPNSLCEYQILLENQEEKDKFSQSQAIIEEPNITSQSFQKEFNESHLKQEEIKIQNLNEQFMDQYNQRFNDLKAQHIMNKQEKDSNPSNLNGKTMLNELVSKYHKSQKDKITYDQGERNEDGDYLSTIQFLSYTEKALGHNKKQAEKNAGWKMYDKLLWDIVKEEFEKKPKFSGVLW